MDAYDAVFEAMKQETCMNWRYVETMFVGWKRPVKSQMCVLLDQKNPPCAECERYVPRKP